MRGQHQLLIALRLAICTAEHHDILSARQETASPPSPSITAVSDCHLHGTVQYCIAGTAEFQMDVSPTSGEVMPTEYTGCHSHSTTYCQNAQGETIQLLLGAGLEGPETPSVGEGTEPEHGTEAAGESSGTNCHFHAGVEHCVGGAEEEGFSAANCERRDRDYNIPLRVGLLFVMLVTGSLGVFFPILLTQLPAMRHTDLVPVLLVLKQFGTGVIISTAFVHLYTHAQLMFANECLGELEYEATTSAVVMAGIFMSFVVEYISHRFARSRRANAEKHLQDSNETTVVSKEGSDMSTPIAEVVRIGHHSHGSDSVGVKVMEAGIIFHSLLIGITLVVAGDSFFITLFIVIVFHQFFEGVALGSCIAGLLATSLLKKVLMALTFALVTPVGMAIGIGVLDQFNGNDPSTLIAIGTLDAFSAGILIWVGVVEMLAADWFQGGPLADASIGRIGIAGLAFVAGAALMSLLGKWA